MNIEDIKKIVINIFSEELTQKRKTYMNLYENIAPLILF